MDANKHFFFDVHRRERGTLPNQDIAIVSDRRSSCDSSSSKEVILFRGRNAAKTHIPHRTISLTAIETEIRAVEQQLSDTTKTHHQVPLNTVDDCLRVGARGHRQRKRQNYTADNEEEAIIADYIANLQENGEMFTSPHHNTRNHRDLGGMGNSVGGLPEFQPQYSMNQIQHSTDTSEAEITDHIVEDKYKLLKQGISGSGNDSTSIDTLKNNVDDDTSSNVVLEGKILNDNEAERDAQASSGSEVGPDIESEQDEMENEFDFMDWERPSIRQKKGKWAQVKLQLNNSDSELEQKLQAAWKNDRMRKSQRKKQREELRALGMLGRKPTSGDLRTKYPAGMSLEQVAEELKAFLLGTDESLLMPSMDKHARKMVHELANKFNIKSKSTGKADQRRPTLYRTGRTLLYEELGFDNAVKRINRKFFPRLDVRGKQSRVASNRANHSAVIIRDGEIVGGAAPELGIENRGRTILEKMGWSNGTALGAMDNKGILQPVTHTMKRSKAGLG
ncbi:Protein SQS1 [Cladobotryum mycophilum]|uniref:Protein SQS1 n=1 Tax=Cladobotryum mycophilum TaxID=491253 RepID=A0ABR0SUX0_9HYPO